MRLVLKITVDYDEVSTTRKKARTTLMEAANHLSNNCLLSGNTDAIVDEWDAEVE